MFWRLKILPPPNTLSFLPAFDICFLFCFLFVLFQTPPRISPRVRACPLEHSIDSYSSDDGLCFVSVRRGHPRGSGPSFLPHCRGSSARFGDFREQRKAPDGRYLVRISHFQTVSRSPQLESNLHVCYSCSQDDARGTCQDWHRSVQEYVYTLRTFPFRNRNQYTPHTCVCCSQQSCLSSNSRSSLRSRCAISRTRNW